MKKVFKVLILLWILLPSTSFPENYLYIDSITAFAGDELTLSVKMKNSAPIRGFQFKLHLPTGITAVKNAKDRIQVALCEDRLEKDDEHTISATEQNDGSILVLCGSQYDEDFTGCDGEVVTVNLKVDENVQRGDYNISLQNIKLTEGDINNFYETSIYSSVIQVLIYTLGDINGDQQVDVSDYIGIANRIHGNTPKGFIEKDGDVNADSVIDISDYIGVANLIHTGSIYGDELHVTITTNDASNIGEKGATLNGTLTVVSATKPYTVGFFVSSEGSPSKENYIKHLESGCNKRDLFSSTVSDLSYSTTYYYCSYILYEGTYYYGDIKTFATTRKTTFAIGDLYPNDENPIGIVYAVSVDNYGKSGWIASIETVSRNWYGAKNWASSYKGGGWSLPSQSELQRISRNFSRFNQLSSGRYWSSNVQSEGAIYTYAYYVMLGGSSNGYYTSANAENQYKVIAIRKF